MINVFREFYKELRFGKKLNQRQIGYVRNQIDALQFGGRSDTSMIRSLRRRKELREKWKAERALQTERVRLSSIEAKEDAKEYGYEKFYVLLEPDACQGCRRFAGNGRRIFTKDDIGSGNNIIIPHHPNCRCQLRLYE